MGNIKPSNIPNRLKNPSKEHPYVAGAVDIYDDRLNQDQQDVNQDTYRKSETYSKEQLNNLITTPEQQYVTVTADDQTVDVTDVLPETGEADTIYRVGNWDGEQYDPTVYSEYAWDGINWVILDCKSYGIDSHPIPGSHNTIESGAVYHTLCYSEVCYNFAVAICDNDFFLAKKCEIIHVSSETQHVVESIDTFFCYNVFGYIDNKYMIKKEGEVVPSCQDTVDDSMLRFFSKETVIDVSTSEDPDGEYFCGFTQMVYYEGILYLFYRRASGHGIDINNLRYYYKMSTDNGETWSERQEIDFSGVLGGNRDCRHIYPVLYEGKLLALVFVGTGHMDGGTLIRTAFRTAYCQFSANSEGRLSIEEFSFLPLVLSDGTIVDPPVNDADCSNSNVIAGPPAIKDGYLYWIMYESVFIARLYRWRIKAVTVPAVNTMECLHTFSDNDISFCEASICVSRDFLNISILDVMYGKDHDCNHNYIYHTDSGECEEIAVTSERYAGVMNISILNGKYIIQAGRDSGKRKSLRFDCFSIFSGGNIPIREFIPLIGKDMYSAEGMYPGMALIGNTLYISYYYITSDRTHYVACKSMDVRDIESILVYNK